MLEMETDFAAFVLVSPRKQPGTERPKAVVPLRSVTHRKAQVPKMRFRWNSDLNFKILNLPPTCCLPLSSGSLPSIPPRSRQAPHSSAWGYLSSFRVIPNPGHDKALSPDQVCRKLFVPGSKPRLRPEHLRAKPPVTLASSWAKLALELDFSLGFYELA